MWMVPFMRENGKMIDNMEMEKSNVKVLNFLLTDGSQYEGEFYKGARHGQGKLVTKDGC